nr:zinc finger protein 548-like isoform X1 [Rattus norvegicus]|eukprot:XP_006227787.1 PREDICTED: zinc finger protein 548-like [Rattus norvegicus]
MAEAPVNQGESYVSLEDVCLRFTAEEWGLLDDAQKLLYHNVMLENFSLVLSLGLPISKSFPGRHNEGSLRERKEQQTWPLGASGNISAEDCQALSGQLTLHFSPEEGTQVYPSWPYLFQKDKHTTVEPSINI